MLFLYSPSFTQTNFNEEQKVMSPRAKVDLLVLFPEADVSMMHGHVVSLLHVVLLYVVLLYVVVLAARII